MTQLRAGSWELGAGIRAAFVLDLLLKRDANSAKSRGPIRFDLIRFDCCTVLYCAVPCCTSGEGTRLGSDARGRRACVETKKQRRSRKYPTMPAAFAWRIREAANASPSPADCTVQYSTVQYSTAHYSGSQPCLVSATRGGGLDDLTHSPSLTRIQGMVWHGRAGQGSADCFTGAI